MAAGPSGRRAQRRARNHNGRRPFGRVVERIVSLVPAATEICFEVGVGDKVRAVSHACDTPPAAAKLPSATRARVDAEGTGRAIDEAVREASDADEPLYEVLEEVLHHAQPDLVITQDACSVCGVTPVDVEAAMARIEPVHRPEVLSLHPHTLEDVIEDIRRVGRATGATAEGAELADRLEARVDGVRERVQAVEERPRVAVLDWLDPPMAAGHWVPGMVETAGGEPVLVEGTEPSRYVEWTEVVQADPERLVLAPCGFDLDRARKDARQLRRRDGWGALAAVQTGRVVAVDAGAYLARPGPRLLDGLEQLAVAIHGPPLAEAYPEQAQRIDTVR